MSSLEGLEPGLAKVGAGRIGYSGLSRAMTDNGSGAVRSACLFLRRVAFST